MEDIGDDVNRENWVRLKMNGEGTNQKPTVS